MKFGDKITIDHKLKRRTCHHTVERRSKKYWKKELFKEPKEAIVIGERTLSEGFREWEGEIGYIYYPIKYFKVILVATDMRSNPFYVHKKIN